MINSLNECVNQYIKEGYTRNYAISKVCQDIIINRIYNSKYSDRRTISSRLSWKKINCNNIRQT